MGRFCFIPTIVNPESAGERLERGGAVSSAIMREETEIDPRLKDCGQMPECRRCQYNELRGTGAVVASGDFGDPAYEM